MTNVEDSIELIEDDNKRDSSGNEPSFNLKREVFEWLEAVVFSMVVVVLLFTFIFRIVGVEGPSMQPTLHTDDRVVISHLFYKPKPKDIIVITQPNSVNKPIIKRIIAVEGQTVDIDFKKGIVKVDGVTLNEPYIAEPTYNQYDVTFPLKVSKGEVFVMGDNRNDSLDSRDSGVGMIDERYILGKAVFRIFPFKSIGVLK
ncbi:MAG: signal peptidase [Oscillospiraceae bacterium]|nr:signal peptidase [Oscillospiraceae bacterium]